MQIPLRITFHGTTPSEAIEARVRTEVDALERYHSRITSCHVTIEEPARHQHTGGIWGVHVVMSIPTGDITVNRAPGQNHAHEDVYVAIRDAFSAVRRQLQDRTQRARGDVKAHEPE